MSEEETKKLRTKELIKLILVTPALVLGIGYGGSFIAGALLGFVVIIYYHILGENAATEELMSLFTRLIVVSGGIIFFCSFVIGGTYGIKKAFNLWKIQRHLSKMKRPLDNLLPDMSQAEAKKLRNKDLIKLILITPALILAITFGSDPIAQIIVGVLGGIYISTSVALSFALTGNPDSFQVGWSFSPLIYVLRFVLLTGGFVLVGIYAIKKVRNLYKIKSHLSGLKQTSNDQ